jgi:hypothetical protein
MKPLKGKKTAHAPATQRGTGDYYGTGVKNKVGKARGLSMIPPDISKKKTRKFPTPAV